MNYCEHCGAANDILNATCHRCGQPLPQDALPQEAFAPAAAPVPPVQSASASPLGPSDMSGQPLGASLDLPDWLKSAAAATPEAPPVAPAANQPPAGFHVAPQGNNVGTNELFAGRVPLEPPAPARPAQPLPPVPSAGLSDSLPDWLRNAAPTPVAPAHPAPMTDQANPASFISENDLPDWIRQIAAQDEAKRVEEERLAAAAAATEAAAEKRAPLPGDASSVAATNPWLTRRDQAASSSAWGSAAPGGIPAPAPAATPNLQAEHAFEEDEAPEVVHVDPSTVVPAAEGGKRSKKSVPQVSMPKVSVPKLSVPKMSKPSLPSTSAGSPGKEGLVRYALIGAIALLVFFVLVALVL